MQARFDGQSELTVHSGRQFGALPIMPGVQPHSARPPTTWHLELGPHGCGSHGFDARGFSVLSSTTGVGTGARQRSHWLLQCPQHLADAFLTRNYATTRDRIAGPSGWAAADRIVVHHSTGGVTSASSGAWVLTLVVLAGLRRSAVRVGRALGPTLGRHAQIAGQARADRRTAHLAALAVRSARSGRARSLNNARLLWHS